MSQDIFDTIAEPPAKTPVPTDVFDQVSSDTSGDVFDQVAAKPYNPDEIGQAEAQQAIERNANFTLPQLKQWSETPLLPHVRAPQQEGLPMQIVAGVNNAAGALGEGLSTPQNLALLPLAGVKHIGRLVAAGFGAKMLSDIPEQIRQTEELPAEDYQGRTEGGLSVIANLLLGVGAAKHAAGGKLLIDPAKAAAIEAELRKAEHEESTPQTRQDSDETARNGNGGVPPERSVVNQETESESFPRQPHRYSQADATPPQARGNDVFDEVAIREAKARPAGESIPRPAWSADPNSREAYEADARRSYQRLVEVAPKTVRLYHGASKAAGQAGRDFTPSRDYAEGYASKSSDPEVWYVDVPEDSPFLTRDEENGGYLLNRQIVPDEIANQAKRLDEVASSAQTTAVATLTSERGEVTTPDSNDTGVSQPTPTRNETTAQDVTGISKAAIAAQREARDLPEIERAKQEDFGTLNDDANALIAEDPLAPRRLVDELADNPRSLQAAEAPLLVRRMQEAQAEFDRAIDAQNRAPEDQSAQARLEQARAEYDKVVTTVQDSTSAAGAGLNSVKLLLAQDFSLAHMESKARATLNKGRPFDPKNPKDAKILKWIQETHADIVRTEKAGKAYEASPKRIRRMAYEYAKKGLTFNDILRIREEQTGKIRERRKVATQPALKLSRSDEAKRSVDTDSGFSYSLPDDVRKAFSRSTNIEDAMALHAFAKAIERDPHRRASRRDKARLQPVAYGSHLPAVREISQAELILQRHGRKAVWFRNESGEQVNAAIMGKHVFLNVDSVIDPVHQSAAHELVHAMRREAPEAYHALAKVLDKETRGRSEAYNQNRLQRGYKASELKEELVADFVGETIGEPRQLAELLHDNPTLFHRISAYIQDFIEKIKRKLAGVGPDDIPTARDAIKNLEKAQRAMREAFREFRKTDNAELSIEEPSFSRQQPKESAPDEDILLGADHLHKGARSYEDWAQAMRDDGSTPTPELYQQSKQFHDDTAAAFRTPEEKRLARLKTGTSKRTEEIRAKLETGDFSKRVRNVTQPDAELNALRAEHERAKDEYRHGLEQQLRKQRPFVRKMVDTFVDVARMLKLTGITTLGKLGGAGLTRMGATPLEEAAGAAIGKFPILRKVAEAAPREGKFSFRAEGKALAGTVQGIRDIPHILKGNRTNAEALAGEKLRTKSRLDYPGRIHQVIKAPFKEAERARSIEKLTQHAERQGWDTSDPQIQDSIQRLANQNAKRAIFMQDNVLSEGFNNVTQWFEHSKKFPVGGYLIAKTGRFLLPIVKVPTNVAFETATYLGGGFSATGKLMQVMHRGLKTIKPEEADLILRHYKKGAVGIGIFLTGYFNADNFGGLYTKGEQQSEKERKKHEHDLKHGQMSIAGVTVPAWLLHAPAFLAMQAGATAFKLTHGDKPKGPWRAGLSVARAVTEQIPFMAEMGVIDNALADDYKGTAVRGRILQGTVVPQGVKNVAEYMDNGPAGPIQRKPKTEVDYLKAAVPGLRQQVPTVDEAIAAQKSKRKHDAMTRHLRGN